MPKKCRRCDSPLNTRGRCKDVTCPFSNHEQTCHAGFNGHPDYKYSKCTCKSQTPDN